MSINIQPEDHKPANIIQRQADGFLEEYFGWDLTQAGDYKKGMSLVREYLYEYRKSAHKLEFLERIRFRLKQGFDAHYAKCKAIKRGEPCEVNDYFENMLFFLQNEIEDIEADMPASEVSRLEKEALNNSVDNIINGINTLQLGQQVIYEDVLKEFQELKEMYFLNKKNWLQLFTGKVTEMVAGGMISETLSKDLLKLISETHKQWLL